MPWTTSKELGCKAPGCQKFCTKYLGEVIQHLRTKHDERQFIKRRPGPLTSDDPHGEGGGVWYCVKCGGHPGEKYRSFDSHQALWNHLRLFHAIVTDKIVDYEEILEEILGPA